MPARKSTERILARDLRARGFAYKRIALELGVSPSSVYQWTKDVELTEEQKWLHARWRSDPAFIAARTRAWSELNRDRRRLAQHGGRERARTASEPLHHAGCMLYWAEGSKSRNRVRLVNPDVHMVRFFVRFLRECFAVPGERLSLTLSFYTGNGLTVDQIERYWLERLALPASCVRKHAIDNPPTSSSGRRRKSFRTASPRFRSAIPRSFSTSTEPSRSTAASKSPVGSIARVSGQPAAARDLQLSPRPPPCAAYLRRARRSRDIYARVGPVVTAGLAASADAPRALTVRATRPSQWLPPLAAAGSMVIGVVNVGTALAAHLPSGLQSLLDGDLVARVPLVHAGQLPIGVSLIFLGLYLGRRRRGAWALAVALVVVGGALDVIKSHDFAEGVGAWTIAAVLASQRKAFFVRQDRQALRAALWRVPLAVATAGGIASLAVWFGSRPVNPHVSPHHAWHETRHLLTLRGGDIHFHPAFSWVPFGVHVLALVTILFAFYLLLRPLQAPRQLPNPRARRLARDLVETHGADTLSYFKLRQDKHYLFSADERAFVGYQVAGRRLLISADPVGPPDALPALMRDVFAWAEVRGLKIGFINAGESTRELAAAAGLRSFYFGDEAILDLQAFSLEGRPIRKIRQSVTRLTKAGYTASIAAVGELDDAARRELEAVSDRWRGKDRERGFSMCMDSVCGRHQPDSTVVIARDADGSMRGFLHIVPAFGRPAASLSAMRRERDTPNGLTEFLVVRAIELLRERDVAELSLNFAAFGRWMHDPRNRREALLGRLAKPLNPFFQIESLYKFNAKFFPRWEPRYLLYEGRVGLLPTGIASLIVEGQLPRPRLPQLRRRRAGARLAAPSTSST
jgi:lysyl-tRNA synthetase class 2